MEPIIIPKSHHPQSYQRTKKKLSQIISITQLQSCIDIDLGQSDNNIGRGISPQKVQRIQQRGNKTFKKINASNKNILSDQSEENSLYLKKIQEQLAKNLIGQYFTNFNEFLTMDKLVTCKKYMQLSQGLYIMISGKICFLSNSKQHSISQFCTRNVKNIDIDRKYQLFNAAKTGLFSLPNTSAQSSQDTLSSFCLEQNYSIIQCVTDNCLVLQDSILIKVSSFIKEQTKFEQFFKQRCALIKGCHLGSWMFSNSPLFSVDMYLHSTFKKHKYTFHQILQLQNIGIVQNGVVRPTKVSKQSKSQYYQMQRYSVLLPGNEYEVITMQCEIMQIQNNPTLQCYHKDLILGYQRIKNKKKKNDRLFHIEMCKQRENIKNKKGSSSCYYNIHSYDDRNNVYSYKRNIPIKLIQKQKLTNSLHSLSQNKGMKKWEINKRRQDLLDISKRFSNQMVIPMQMCKQNLEFSSQQISKLKAKKESIEFNRKSDHQMSYMNMKNPRALFDFNKYYVNENENNDRTEAINKRFLKTVITVELKRQKQRQKERGSICNQLRKKSKKQRMTHNCGLLGLYENFSKDMLEKFKKQRNTCNVIKKGNEKKYGQ